jgi:hypothetical protein
MAGGTAASPTEPSSVTEKREALEDIPPEAWLQRRRASETAVTGGEE